MVSNLLPERDGAHGRERGGLFRLRHPSFLNDFASLVDRLGEAIDLFIRYIVSI